MTYNATRQNAGPSLEQRLQYLEDRIEIQDLMVRYGLGQDLHEDGDNDVLEQWDSVFAPEARVDYSVAGARS